MMCGDVRGDDVRADVSSDVTHRDVSSHVIASDVRADVIADGLEPARSGRGWGSGAGGPTLGKCIAGSIGVGQGAEGQWRPYWGWSGW